MHVHTHYSYSIPTCSYSLLQSVPMHICIEPSLYMCPHASMFPYANKFTCIAIGLYKCPHKSKFCHVQWTLTTTDGQRVHGNCLKIILCFWLSPLIRVQNSRPIQAGMAGRYVCVWGVLCIRGNWHLPQQEPKVSARARTSTCDC